MGVVQPGEHRVVGSDRRRARRRQPEERGRRQPAERQAAPPEKRPPSNGLHVNASSRAIVAPKYHTSKIQGPERPRYQADARFLGTGTLARDGLPRRHDRTARDRAEEFRATSAVPAAPDDTQAVMRFVGVVLH